MTAGYVVFRLGERTMATPLECVREIVRLGGLEQLPGTAAPMSGLMVVRGVPLPVLDLRAAGSADATGDLLVLHVDDDALGLAVDAVTAVLAPDELPHVAEPARGLPAYVVGVHGYDGRPVLLVDVRRMLDAGLELVAQT